MSRSKSRTPCFVAGCSIVAVIFIVAVVMLSVLFLHIPNAASFYKRMQNQAPKVQSVLAEAATDGPDLSHLSEQSRNIYLSLQAGYQSREEGGEPFACSAIVEYYNANSSAGDKDYMYGMLIYTDGIGTAYSVFTNYYRIASEQDVDFSTTDYFLFVRGNAIFVGNNRAFLKAYMNNLF